MAINGWRTTSTAPDYLVYTHPEVATTNSIPTTPTVNNVAYTWNVSNVPAFSNYDVYNLKAQAYNNQWNDYLSNLYWWIANNLWRYSQFANNTLWVYDKLYNSLAQWQSNLQWMSGELYNQLVGDMSTQRQYVYDMFWPEWQLTKEVNSYYDDLDNYLSADAWQKQADIAAQWMHSWASLQSIRAQQNEAYNQSFSRYIQAKEQQINAKQQIAANLINFMSQLRKEYWDTTNQYVISAYKEALDMLNKVNESAAWDVEAYNKALAQSPTTWWGSSTWTSSLEDLLNQIGWANSGSGNTEYRTKEWNVTRYNIWWTNYVKWNDWLFYQIDNSWKAVWNWYTLWVNSKWQKVLSRQKSTTTSNNII